MASPFEKTLDKLGKDLGGKFVKLPPKPRGQLAYPFSEVSYKAECPNGHMVELSTGYCVFAPSSWEQIGWCEHCGSYYHRFISEVRNEKTRKYEFVASNLTKGLR